MLALEPRVMLDGAIAMAAVDQAESNPDAQDNQQAKSNEPVAQSNTDSEGGNAAASDNGDATGPATPPADRIVIIVDAAVADAQELLAGVDPSAEIFYLSGDTDGVHQITALLAGETGISELHILSHGETGSVTLGNTVLSAANAETYASEFTVWDSALNDGADILLYGCNIVEDAAGKAFLDLMADLTNADLAASNDLTGNSGLGGDWDLEVATGTIEAGLPLDTAAIDGYAHTLLFVPTNTAPSLTDLTVSATVLEREAPVVLDSDVTVTDQEQNWDGGVLTIAGLDTNDVLAVQTVGNGAGETSVTGNAISVGGTVVGSFTGGTGGTALVITFNANADNAAVERVIENLVFSNASDTPVAARTLSLTLVDGGGLEARGTTQTLAERTGTDNPLSGITVSRAAAPTFVDIDADGDLDVFVGSVNGDLRFFRNTGSPTAPSYTEETGANNPLDGFSVNFDSSPTFVDIDNNGVLDAFVGQQDGTIVFFRNTGTDTAPAFTRVDGSGNPLNGINAGFLATPTFVDVNNDGDFDAFIGRSDGTVAFYENTGGPGTPAFSLVTGANDPFDGFDFGAVSKPDFVDFDGDGDFDAIVGSLDGGGALTYVRNDGTPTNPNFTIVTGPSDPFDALTVQSEARPVFADIDGDGDPDLFVGGFDGSTAFFETDTRFDIAVNVTAVNSTPVVTPPVGPLAATEQTDLAIHGSGFSADDPDTGGGPGTLTLTVGEGTLTVDVGDSGVSIISGDGSSTVVLEGTLDQVNALLGGTGTGTIFYRSIGGTPSPSTTITVTYNDRGATGIDPGLTADDTSEEGTASQTITITTDNDPPVVDADTDTVAFVERDGSNNPGNLGGIQFLTGVDFTVTDPDSTTFGVITISLTDTSGNAVAGDTMRVRPQDHGGALRDKLVNATITGNNASNVLTVTAAPGEEFTAAEVELILEELRLRIAEDSPEGPATRDLTITVTDAGDGSGGATATSDPFVLQVNVTGVNDTPAWERQGRFPDAQAFTDEDTPLNDVFQSARDYHTTNTSNLSQFQLQDRDDDTNVSGGTPERLTLRVENGTLTFTPGSGVTLVSGNGTNEVVVEGSIVALRNFVNANGSANLAYSPNADFNGVDTLTMSVNDQTDLPIVGNAKTSTDRTVLINVDPVNDPPVVTADTDSVDFVEIDGRNNVRGGPQFLTDVTFSVTDADSTGFGGIAITIGESGSGNPVDGDTLRVRPADHQGELRAKLNASVIVGNNTSNTLLIFAPPGTPFTAAEVEAILQELRLGIAENSPEGPAIRDLSVVVADAGDGTGNLPSFSSPLTLQVNVTGVNDTPAWERQDRFPDARATTDEDTPLTDVFDQVRGNHQGDSGTTTNQFRLTDRDDDTREPNGTPEQLTLRVENGTLTFTEGSGVTLVSGNGTNEVVVEGRIGVLNRFVNGLGNANLDYSPNQDFNGTDTLTMTVTDQGDLPIVGNVKTSTERTVLITVEPVNDAPVVQADTDAVSFTEIDGSNNPGNLGGPQFLTGVDFTVTDVDSTTFSVITIRITDTNGNAVDDDTLRVRPQDHGSNGTPLRDKLNNATITGNNSSNFITVTAGPGESFTAAEVEAILEELRLRIAEDTPAGPAPRDLTITVADTGDGQGNEPVTSDPLVLRVDVSGVNDTPAWERQNRFPDAQAFTDEDTPLADVFQNARDYHTANTSNLSQFQLQDRDDDTNVSGGTPERLTLRVENGTLTFTPGSGVTLVSGNGTNEVVVEGSISALRNFVNANGSANLAYSPNADFNGVDTLTMSVNDQGDLPIVGNAKTSTDRTVLINVDPVNDAPVNGMPEPQVMNEDSTLVLSAGNGNGISVTDIDAGNGTVTTIVSVTTGALNLTEGGGATINGNGGSIVTVSGTLAEVNAALASITYTPPADFNGGVTLTVETSDGGNTGKGGPLTDTDSVAITVNPVNDPPVNSMPSNQTTLDDTPLVFSPSGGNGLSVSDIDAGSGAMTTTLSVTAGSLTAAGGSGAVINGNGTATIVISGTTAQINAALAGLTFTPVDVGSSSLTVLLSMTTNDNGNTGAGGPLSASNQIAITIEGELVSPGPDDDPDPLPDPDDTPDSETDGLFDGDPLEVGQLPAGPALFDDLEPFAGDGAVDPIITAGIGGEPPIFGNPFDPDNLPGNIDLVRESDTGLFDNDDITRDNTPELTGSAPADTQVVITSSIGGVIGTAETDENGVWRLQAPVMADGAHELVATPIDEEGSEGTASVPLLVIIDTQAPEAPPAPALDGEIDQLKANEQVPLQGTAEPGARVVVTSDKDGVVGEVVADENGNWSLVIASLSADTHAIQVSATDVAGNASEPSPALTLTVLPEDDSASLGTMGGHDLAHLLSGFAGPASDNAEMPADVTASTPGAVGFTRQVQLAGL